MRSRALYTLLLLVLDVAGSKAQQDPLYGQYMFNTLAFNPAYAGSREACSMMALSRHQWVGFAGAPSTQTISIHTPVVGKSLAAGLLLLNDKAGPVAQLSAYTSVAYRMPITSGSNLAFALSGGGDVQQTSLADLTAIERDASNVNSKSGLLPNAGAGLYFQSKRWYLGASVPKLLENQLTGNSTSTILVQARQVRHYFLMGGAVMDLGHDLKFKPTFMARAVEGAPLSLDVNANFLLLERIWFGAMYRLGNSFGFSAQYRFSEQLYAGYAFDLTSRLAAYNAGTHEVMVGYDMRFAKGKSISPRYF
jgi:type IX secretion system PorP/SprF family membrane protein